MVAKTHHALRKARIFHARHRNQQMPGQIIARLGGGGFTLFGQERNRALPARSYKPENHPGGTREPFALAKVLCVLQGAGNKASVRPIRR
jgi:hypothetical protein